MHQTRGNVAMMFGMALPLLLMVGLGAVDIHQASRVKANLQDALDAAALVAARSSHTTADAIQQVGLDALKANMPDYYKAGSGDTASFVLRDNVLVASAKVNVKVLVANIILPPYGKFLDDYLPVSTSSEVLRASRNVEVGLALDVTVSMQGSKLKALKDAAKELVDIVVQEQQSPFYSKIGLAPYSQGVNLGGRAGAARGEVPAPKVITNVEWSVGNVISITNITRADTAVFTANSHGLQDGNVIYLSDVSGTNGISTNAYTVKREGANTFTLKQLGGNNSVNTKNASGKGTITAKAIKCARTDCSVKVISSGHGFKNKDFVRFESLDGMDSLNGNTYEIKDVESNSFVVDRGPSDLTNYKSGGEIWCTTLGCRFYRFVNASSGNSIHEITSCTSERVGTHAYTDVAPSVSFVGRNYPASLNQCPGREVVPLTSTKSDLVDAIDKLEVTGTTAGQIGIAWAWYLVSNNFSTFWGGDSAPGVTDPDETLKVVVLMTDGEFNTEYCEGVVAKNASAPSSYVPNSARRNCDRSNGNGFAQSVALCNAMKAQGVIVYTVGFQISDKTGSSGIDTAVELMKNCATSEATHYHNATTDDALRNAFRAIGRDITRLRLAR